MGKQHKPTVIQGRRYVPQVFLINTHESGVFRNVTRIPDEKKIELAGGEEFVVLYVPAHMLKPERGA